MLLNIENPVIYNRASDIKPQRYFRPRDRPEPVDKFPATLEGTTVRYTEDRKG
jgi:hypothetical protein